MHASRSLAEMAGQRLSKRSETNQSGIRFETEAKESLGGSRVRSRRVSITFITFVAFVIIPLFFPFVPFFSFPPCFFNPLDYRPIDEKKYAISNPPYLILIIVPAISIGLIRVLWRETNELSKAATRFLSSIGSTQTGNGGAKHQLESLIGVRETRTPARRGAARRGVSKPKINSPHFVRLSFLLGFIVNPI